MTAEEIMLATLEASKAMISTGLVQGTSGNVSARLPDGNVVLTPSSIAYETMEIKDLVVCTLEGKVLVGDRAPTSEKALHLACLRAHPDIGAVMHSHALYSTMFALVHEPIPCAIVPCKY